MYFLESEIIEYFNNQHGLNAPDTDILYTPIQSVTLKRNSNLELVLKTTSNENAKTQSKKTSSGIVYINKNEFILKDTISKRLYTLSAITPYSWNESINMNNLERIELSSINSIKSILEGTFEEKYLIEFVSNMDMKDFILSDNISIKKSIIEIININKINFENTTTNKMNSRGCIQMTINDFTLYICRYTQDKQNYQYILYDKIISEEERNKIRDCVSFILGKPIIYLGYSTYTEDSKLVNFKLKSGYDYNGAFDLVPLPPTDLSSNMSNMIDSNVFNSLLISLYDNYETNHFQHLFWMYWHASTSHFYSASVQFGACIESVQNSYLENNSNNKIIDSKEIWQNFRKKNIYLIDELSINDEEKELLKNKINNMNILPQQKQLEKLFDILNIELTALESKTWRQRNIPAHGKKINNNIDYIRGVKILRTLFNRLILKISNSSKYYYDYYSLGSEKSYNLKLLEDGIKDE